MSKTLERSGEKVSGKEKNSLTVMFTLSQIMSPLFWKRKTNGCYPGYDYHGGLTFPNHY